MTAAVVRVVFDANILVSGHFWKGPPYRCLLAAEARLVLLVLSDPIVSELGEKLADKFALTAAEVDGILDRLTTHAARSSDRLFIVRKEDKATVFEMFSTFSDRPPLYWVARFAKQ